MPAVQQELPVKMAELALAETLEQVVQQELLVPVVLVVQPERQAMAAARAALEWAAQAVRQMLAELAAAAEHQELLAPVVLVVQVELLVTAETPEHQVPVVLVVQVELLGLAELVARLDHLVQAAAAVRASCARAEESARVTVRATARTELARVIPLSAEQLATNVTQVTLVTQAASGLRPSLAPAGRATVCSMRSRSTARMSKTWVVSGEPVTPTCTFQLQHTARA